MRFKNFLYFVVFFLLLSACTDKTIKADLIITNAIIWTGNDQQPNASAMAIAGDSILAIGSATEIIQFKSDSTKVKDADGRFISPGFIDSHVHLLMGGNALLSVELRDAKTKEEFTKRISDYVKTLGPGEWVLEGNWDHTLWGGELPTKEWIDEFTEENPVVVYRIDGHMVLANSMALAIAGINSATDDLAAGEIVRNSDGSITGILKGSAMTKMLNAIPPMTKLQKNKAIHAASNYLLSNGVTSVHDVDSLGTFSAAKEMLNNGELAIRIYSADPLNGSHHIKAERHSFGANYNRKWLKTGLLKGFVDGSLGSHTAAFNEEYTDKKGDYGFFITSKEKLYDLILKADLGGKHIAVHAIGDKANATILKIYSQVIYENGSRDRRFRIEHAQHLQEDDMAVIGLLGIIASMQPYHAIDDGRWAEELIGPERIKTTYAFKSLVNNGAILAFGSDWPVAPASPIMGIYAATTRRTLDDKNPKGWIPAQKIDTESALKAYTKNGAFASFDEQIKGTLEAGKLADFVILSEDITKIKAEKIKDIQVLATYVGGKLMFERNKENVLIKTNN